MVNNGLTLSFSEQGPPAPRRIPNHHLTPDQEQWVQQELQQMINDHVICCSENILLYSPLGVVMGKKWRLVLDLRFLNQHLAFKTVKFEGLDTVAQYLRSGWYMAKTDIRRGYWAVPMTPQARRYLGFSFGGKNYTYNAMPFGLASAPAAFTKLLRPVVQYLRSLGLHIVIYLDDILLMSPTKEQAYKDVATLTNLLTDLGWQLNREKSILEPTRCIEFLGLTISTNNTKHGMPAVFIPTAKMASIRKDANRLLRDYKSQRPVPVRHLARWVGTALATARAVAPARAFLRHCQGLIATSARSLGWNGSTKLSLEVAEELSWWSATMRRSSPWHGRAILTPKMAVSADYTLTTDASAWGYGATLALYSDNKKPFAHTQGCWPAEWRAFTWSSNLRETIAVLLSLQSFKTTIANSTTLVRSDNITACAAVRRLVGGSSDLNKVAQSMATLCLNNNIFLWSAHLPGKDNQTADSLSRRWLLTPPSFEWMLSPDTLRSLQTTWGCAVNIDRFATLANTHCDRFCSFLPQSKAEAVDAFSQPWDNPQDTNLINPPFKLLDRVVRKLELEPNTKGILIAPEWPAMPWHRRLQTLAKDKRYLSPTAILAPPQPTFNGEGTTAPEPLRNLQWRVCAYWLWPSKPSVSASGPPHRPRLHKPSWPRAPSTPSRRTRARSIGGSSSSLNAAAASSGDKPASQIGSPTSTF